jgi:hypothetical protein
VQWCCSATSPTPISDFFPCTCVLPLPCGTLGALAGAAISKTNIVTTLFWCADNSYVAFNCGSPRQLWHFTQMLIPSACDPSGMRPIRIATITLYYAFARLHLQAMTYHQAHTICGWSNTGASGSFAQVHKAASHTISVPRCMVAESAQDHDQILSRQMLECAHFPITEQLVK